jgi:hypothetical protein
VHRSAKVKEGASDVAFMPKPDGLCIIIHR